MDKNIRLFAAVDAADVKRVKKLLPKVDRNTAEIALQRARANLRAHCMLVPPELEGLRKAVAEALAR